jgi:uncharacterized protein YbjT (DUF2867 family)
MRVLVTGGTGKLGRELLPKLTQAGHDVVALSRRPLPDNVPVTYAPGDLSTGQGIVAAIRGCEAILHAATDGFGDRYSLRWAIFHSSMVDVRGTRGLLDAAQRAGINHFILTSIVGVDRVPGWPSIYRYFKHKLAAEALVRESSVPWTIVRLTQFHPLLDQIMQWQFGRRGPVVTLDALGQPIDPADAADEIIGHLGREPTLGVVEAGGPEVLTAREIVRAWTTRSGVNRKAHFVSPPGNLGRAMAEGALTCPDNVAGHITWTDWLSRR